MLAKTQADLDLLRQKAVFERKQGVETEIVGPNELARIGLIDPTKVVDGVKVLVPRAYPMYDSNFEEAVATLRAYLADFQNLNGELFRTQQESKVLAAEPLPDEGLGGGDGGEEGRLVRRLRVQVRRRKARHHAR